jgi:hypothetical protein
VVLEDRLHRLDHPQPDLVGAVLAGVAHIDGRSVGEQRRLAGGAPALVAVGREDAGRTADGDQPLGAALEEVGDDPQAPVLSDDEVEALVGDPARQPLEEVRVLMDVAHVGDGEVDLVLAAVEDRHRVAALVQALDDERTGRPGPPDHERARLGHSSHLRRSSLGAPRRAAAHCIPWRRRR